MDGPRGHYATGNKSDRERHIPYDLTYMWNLKKNKTSSWIQRTDWWLPEVGGSEGGKMGEGGQKVQTSSYKINKSWGYKVQHGDCS